MNLFTKFNLHYQKNIFDDLSKSISFEDITIGRKGANMMDYKHNLIPIVRTTTIYHHSIQKFLPIHYTLIENIKK